MRAAAQAQRNRSIIQYIAAAMLCAHAFIACSPTDAPEKPTPGTASAPPDSTTPTVRGIDWFQGGVDAALAEARARQRPVFLYWGAQWCPYCKQVKATIFTRRDVIDRSRHFVAVELDGDAPAAQRAGERFGVTGYPTMIVFSPDGEELTRIPNGLDVEAYADIFDWALNATRPVAASVEAALTGQTLDDDEWQRLAVYSWAQDNNRVLGETSAVGVFKSLTAACPARLTVACSRLYFLYLGERISDVEDAPLTVAEADEALRRVTALLGDQTLIAANLDTVLHAGPEVVAAVTAADSEQRDTLRQAWQGVLGRLADDPGLSTVEQLYASYAPVGFLHMDDPGAAVPADVQRPIRQRVDQAVAATTDPVERHAVISTASSLLRAAGLVGEATALLEAELAHSAQPYYLMSALAGTAEREGAVEAALEWRKRAYESANGESTRFRWGYGYVSGLLRLAPEDIATIQSVTTRLFAELEDPSTAFFGGTQSRAVRLSDRLIEWADRDERCQALAHIRESLASMCAEIPSDEIARQRCDALLNEAALQPPTRRTES